MSRYIQLSDESKSYYMALKSELLSYKNVRNRVSWKFDNFHAGKQEIAKLAVRGKTLCLVLALEPDDYIGSKYKVERTDAKKYEGMHLLYRIINPRRLKYASELIEQLAEKYEMERGSMPDINFYRPYESMDMLLDEGLVREYVSHAHSDYIK
jgi:hypothetical protein